MNVLIVGSGGREHALAWKAAQSPLVSRVFVAPGNAGTGVEKGVENVAIPADDIIALRYFAQEHGISLTIVGPEVPLVAGIVDEFSAAGLACFGPTRAAAQLEGSKDYCKRFLQRHGIPTAAFQTFTRIDDAKAYIQEHALPLVVKADGLAAGKGVVIAHSHEEALAAAEVMLSGNAFGNAGCRIVVEEFLEGEEASFIVMADGAYALPMATSQDHKARDDGDLGPNTGGMGAYSPAPVITPELHARIMQLVIEPTLRGMIKDGTPYTGFLYAGLMITPDGAPKVLEFNCRFGDPETQPILMRLRSDLVNLCMAATSGNLAAHTIEWDERKALGVVMAAKGYPDGYRSGDIIHGLEEDTGPDARVFHAGTKRHDGHIVSSGGRVLCVCALGDSVREAQRSAYNLASKIHWEGAYYRHDIGYRAIAREQVAVGVEDS
ncbi:phosphoribosylamine--glycine ligase [Candidatus Methylospira mobilis]|uniref:Phosphoribosylamine--glycine ligase n=1 Tax=Candidatus Methylospira mobilis TaxID=1808979 RepID=A0A5Q0BKL3_9GAMM|nr:phosphoribosylamine--glycine ligase [Candidatus Methylospira mobilis]QFY42306.1 phosphoribosylamine--glycine ligase [Candidatus Methylospira mobilis]WNV04039.1 phosphoribosylamine--glycine ligase [Candidatus Methylospira mobilis]